MKNVIVKIEDKEIPISMCNFVRGIGFNYEIAADFLDNFCNIGMKDFGEGLAVGKACLNRHPTIQGSIIRFCLGVILAFAEQQCTDRRNEMPVAMAKKIKELVDNGALKAGWII
jgi:hypothetical protein